MADHLQTASSLEWKLVCLLNEWEAARDLCLRRTGKIDPRVEAAHCDGVAKLLRDHLATLDRPPPVLRPFQ